MRQRTMNKERSASPRRQGNNALRLAVQLSISQLSQGIDLAEAIQFAAKYHNVTCAAIQAELSKTKAASAVHNLFSPPR